MARWYLIPERMVVRWEGLRVGKDTLCRVPPLEAGLLVDVFAGIRDSELGLDQFQLHLILL